MFHRQKNSKPNPQTNRLIFPTIFRSTYFWLGILVLIALLSRGLFFWEMSTNTGLLAYNLADGADMKSWIRDAMDRIDHGFMNIQQHFPSLKHVYCDWLALIFILAGGPKILYPILFQLLLGAGNVLLVFYLGRKIFNHSGIAMTAASLYTLSSIFWMYEVIIIRESLSVTFFLIIVALLYSICYPPENDRKFWWKLVALGLVFSLAGSVRYNFYPVSLATIFFLIIWFRKQSWRRYLLIILIFTLACFSLIGLSKWRSWHILKKNNLTAHYQGLNIFSYQDRIEKDLNSDNSCDIYQYYKRQQRDERLGMGGSGNPSLRPADQAEPVGEPNAELGPPNQPVQVKVSKSITRLRFFWGWLRNKAEDTWIWFGSYEIPENVCYYQFYRLSLMMKLFPLNFALLWPWGALGFILAFGAYRKIRLLLLYCLLFSFTFIITIITSRYRLPILAVLTLPAAYSLYYGVNVFRQIVKKTSHRWKNVLKLVAACTFIISCSRFFYFDQPEIRNIKNCFFSQRYFQLLMKNHRYVLAEKEVDYALHHFQCEYGIVALGQVYTKLNQPEKALLFLKQHESEVLDINYTQWLYLMGINHIKLHRVKEGLEYLNAVLVRPDMTTESRKPIEDFIRQLPIPHDSNSTSDH